MVGSSGVVITPLASASIKTKFGTLSIGMIRETLKQFTDIFR